MYNFRCKICGAEFEKMPKICPTPGCGNRNPAMWENIAPAAPRPVLTDEELRELERRKSEERRRLEAEEKARLIEQQRAAEAERQRELDRLRYEEQQRQQAEAEERRRLEAEEKARRLEQQRAAEAERQRELDRLRYEEQQRYAAEQAKLRQEQQRQREEIERQRAEQEQLRQQADSAGQAAAYQNRQTGDFGGFGNTAVNVPQAQNEVSDQNNKKIIILLLIITLLLILLFAGILLIAMMKKSDRSRTSSKYSVEETTTVQTKKTKKTTESTTTTTKASTTTTTPAATTAATTTSAKKEEVNLLSALGKSPDEAVDILEKALGVEFAYYQLSFDKLRGTSVVMQHLYTSETNSTVPLWGIDFNDVCIEYLDDTVYSISFIYCGDENDMCYTYHTYDECAALFNALYEAMVNNFGEPDDDTKSLGQVYWHPNDTFLIALNLFGNKSNNEGFCDLIFGFTDTTLSP